MPDMDDTGIDPLDESPPLRPDTERTDTEPPAGRPPGRRKAVAAVVAALVLLSAGIGIGWGLNRSGTTASSTASEAPLSPGPQTSPSGSELDLEAIARLVDPGVVDINTVVDAVGGQAGSKAAGTGMILTSSGQVLTNNHVIAGATSISVTIVGRSGRHPAIVLGADPIDDVALLQIQGVSGLSTVTLADSSGVTVGQRVVAIGNALGRGGTPTITEGTVSALDRSITVGDESGDKEHLTHLIQAAVQISPGDSGGPLVNGAGQVVGMITAADRNRTVQRVSQVAYAIPVNTAVGIVNEIRAGHSSANILIGETGFLGVEVQDLDPSTAAQLGLSVTSGALVTAIIPGTPAASAGIPSGVVITAINGRKIGSVDELGPAIYSHKPGEQIQVTWLDRNGAHTVTVTLIAGPAV